MFEHIRQAAANAAAYVDNRRHYYERDIKKAIHVVGAQVIEVGKAMANFDKDLHDDTHDRNIQINRLASERQLPGQTALNSTDRSTPEISKNMPPSMAVPVEKSNMELPALMDENPSRRLFALLIGINTYKHASGVSGKHRASLRRAPPKYPDLLGSFLNLAGAVGDADRVRDYLTSPEVGVPKEQITLLCEEQATRENIVKAFQDLAAETNGIRTGDSIVIFYAGHGAQALSPERLLNVPGCPKYTELLVPYDFYDGEPEYMGIPDYTLAALLDSIAKKKGDNITVIFDCCHSASALRGAVSGQYIARAGPEMNFRIPDELDQDIWGGTRALSVPKPLRHAGAASYVFFSACASFELAKERVSDKKGCFTTALLTLLQAVDSRTLSCSQIIQRIEKIEGQNPQCEGLHMGRSIFHGFSSSRRKQFYDVHTPRRTQDSTTSVGDALTKCPTKRPSRGPVKYILESGSAHGLSVGDEFTVYKSQSDDDQNDPIGRLVIDTIYARKSYLRILGKEFTLPSQSAPALLTKPANSRLLIYIDASDGDAHSKLVSLVDALDLQAIVAITSDRSAAHIELSKTSTHLRFDVVDAVLLDKNVSCGYHLVDASIGREELATIFKGLSHYYWHLKRGSPYNTVLPVDIHFCEVTRRGETFGPLDDSNLYESSVVDLEVDTRDEDEDEDEDEEEETCYGLKLTNTSQYDLYPTLFYFDNDDFTIKCAYQPPISKGDSEPPLKRGESLTIGYGLGPGATVKPFTFCVSDLETKMEIGFFKLILSTQPIDLKDVIQDVAVFDATRAMGRAKNAGESPAIWASSNILVIQRLREEPDQDSGS